VTHPASDDMVAQPKAVKTNTSSAAITAEKRFIVVSSRVDDDVALVS